MATLLYMKAVALAGPQLAGQSVHLIPLYGAVLSMLFLGEPLQADPLVFALAVMVCVGIGRTMPVGRTPPRVLAVPSSLNRSEPEGRA